MCSLPAPSSPPELRAILALAAMPTPVCTSKNCRHFSWFQLICCIKKSYTPVLNHHPHLPERGVEPSRDQLEGLRCPSLKERNYGLPVRPPAQHPFLYGSASPSVSEPETTLTPVGIFSFPIPKSALVQWGDLLLLLRAPWLRATAWWSSSSSGNVPAGRSCNPELAHGHCVPARALGQVWCYRCWSEPSLCSLPW